MKMSPSLPPRNRISSQLSEIHKLHSEILQTARMTFDSAARIGEILVEIKAELKHGEWLPWLKANVNFSQQTANNYMRIFNESGRLKSLPINNLTDAYNLLARPSGDIVVEIPDDAIDELSKHLLVKIHKDDCPAWAKGEYSLREYFNVRQILHIVSELRARKGIPISEEEWVETFFLLLENRVRTNASGIYEKFDGKKWLPVLPR